MRFHFLILILFLFSGYAISSPGEKGLKDIATQYNSAIHHYAEKLDTAENHKNLFSKSTKYADEALLLKQNNYKSAAAPARERVLGFDVLTLNKILYSRETFPAIVSFHSFTTLLSDYKNCLLFPKHSFW